MAADEMGRSSILQGVLPLHASQASAYILAGCALASFVERVGEDAFHPTISEALDAYRRRDPC